jgi:c-di-GMP-binding flagellar brake protein YcgR
MTSFFSGADLLQTQRIAQRIEPRTVFHRKGEIIIADASPVPIKTVDISASGMGLIAADPLPPRQPCLLNVTTLHHGTPQVLQLEGVIAYCILSGIQGFRVGIQYKELDPSSRALISSILGTGL